jgi:hypothetical protein|tara:strand:- start:373 stop:1035 length:663 start_codon:yes stop_codon:yes gene_type:complete
MSFTYSGLKTAVQNYIDSSETTFVNTLDTFIQQAENRIFNTIELNVFRKNVTGTAASGNQYLSAPTDFISPLSLAVLDSDSKYTYLLLKHPSFMRNYTTTAATTGSPKYYGQFDDDTFILAPTPNANLTFELHYLYQPNSLTAAGDSGTTWVSKNAPDLLLYGTLVEASVFLKQDLNETNMFESRFQENLVRLSNLMEGRSTRDENRFDKQRGFSAAPPQ